jgi:hypothetical protein
MVFNKIKKNIKSILKKDKDTEKKADEVNNNYAVTGSSIALAESQTQIANPNYSTYVSSQTDSKKTMEPEYRAEAEELAKKYKKSYDTEVIKINTLLDNYNMLLVNFKNVEELYNKYKKENSRLFKQLKNQKNDTITNERQTYYEDQEIETLNSYYFYILWIIYIIVFIYYAIFYLIFPSQISFIIRVLVLCIFIVLPFVSTWILGKIIQLVYWLFSFIPKNVYK